MKKLLLGLTILASMSSFAGIEHKNCNVESILESTKTLDRELMISTLRQKNYLVSDNVAINQNTQLKDGLEINLDTYLIKPQAPNNAITKAALSFANLVYGTDYLAIVAVKSADKSVDYRNKSKKSTEYNFENEMTEEAMDLLESVPSCKIN
jgi:hypothetical protein